uniref:Uncharacterized protein n=1 Tax=Knipowitschia caucasica TaxID=637954 RepID=A0AAV2LI62_KNICA
MEPSRQGGRQPGPITTQAPGVQWGIKWASLGQHQRKRFFLLIMFGLRWLQSLNHTRPEDSQAWEGASESYTDCCQCARGGPLPSQGCVGWGQRLRKEGGGGDKRRRKR